MICTTYYIYMSIYTDINITNIYINNHFFKAMLERLVEK